MLGHSVFGGGFVIVLLIAIWVAMDANKRGMNGVLWAIGVFLLCIVFLPIYLIVRKPILSQQPYGQPPIAYGQPPQPPQAYQPPAGPSGPQFCSNCGTQVPGGSKFCASCGRPV